MTEIRTAEMKKPIIESSLEDFGDILDSIREPILVLASDLRVVKANRSFYRAFKVEPDQTEGTYIYDLGNRQWNIPGLRQLLEKILPDNAKVDDFVVEHTFATIGRKTMHLNGCRIERETTGDQLIFLAIKDVTEQIAHDKHLEKLVKKRTHELIAAKEAAESSREITEGSRAEIHRLKVILEEERAYLQEEIKLAFNHESIIGHSTGLKYVLCKIEQIAGSNTTVLVLGETGTGKELVARAIHALSPRSQRALIKVNCAALPANLIESELFGHEKGSFTDAPARHLGRFEIADGATIFLDEIGELPLELQAKLLRVLEEGEFDRVGGSRTIKVDTRIIAATNRNLEEEVRQGNFREDLWYRLNVFPITIPPLRDRRDDIPALVDFFIGKICRRLGKQIEVVPDMTMRELQNYRWPGNIRELENVLERAIINSPSPRLQLADRLERSAQSLSAGPKTLEAVERKYILQVLDQTNWKVSGKDSAAEILDLDRSTLRARMRKLNIQKP
jgi:transcriptional regulator with GAF, ATPase, and Fis domain